MKRMFESNPSIAKFGVVKVLFQNDKNEQNILFIFYKMNTLPMKHIF
jgi:hypothetical protein